MNDISSDDIFLLKQRLAEQEALIHALQEKLSNREREIDHLQAQLDKLRRMNFGSRSEKVSRRIAQMEADLNRLQKESDTLTGRVADICYVPMRGHIRFCGLNAWGCQKRSVVWLSHLPDVMASVSFIWMPALNACRVYPLSTGNQEQHEIINHGNRTGYSDCVAAGQYRLRIGNYL